MSFTPGPRNLITDVPGLVVGNAADSTLKSGVTVLTSDTPFVAGAHVMGGAPGTRETDALAPENTVQEIDAIVLSGGSAFGLDAASGVQSGLRADGRGYDTAGHRIPIVPAAIIFDLNGGGDHSWTENPYAALGRRAYDNRSGQFALGSQGAGKGANCARLKGGLGSASLALESGSTIGALVAVNPIGSVNVGDSPHYWAAPFELEQEFGGLGVHPGPAPAPDTKFTPGGHTAIAVIATDIALSKSEATRIAIAAHDGIARAIVPSHTPYDGDLVFSVSAGTRSATPDELVLLGHFAANCLARAIARAVFHATSEPGDTKPSWQEKFG